MDLTAQEIERFNSGESGEHAPSANTTTDTTYNGWSNYATWRVNLEIVDDIISHLSNDVEDGDIPQFNGTYDIAQYLEQQAEESVSGYGELENNKSADLALSYALAFLSTVNWDEIAEHAAYDYPHLIAPEDEEEEEWCPDCMGTGEYFPCVKCTRCQATGVIKV